MIKRNSAIFFTGINAVYLVFFVLLMIWTKTPIIWDVNKLPSVSLSNNALAATQIIVTVLSAVIFIGLITILNTYKEYRWVIIALTLYLLQQVFSNITSILTFYQAGHIYIFSRYTAYFIYAILLFMVISLQFVKNRQISEYYRWFGLTILLAIILARVMPLIYGNTGIKWLLINPGILKMIPFIISLSLFIKLAKRAR